MRHPPPADARLREEILLGSATRECFRVDRIFRALADATRRDIVRRALLGEQSVSQLADEYDMSFAAVQKHVAVLERAGLVTKHPRGRERLVRGNPDTIHAAQALLDSYEQLWRSRVSRLDALLRSDR